MRTLELPHANQAMIELHIIKDAICIDISVSAALDLKDGLFLYWLTYLVLAVDSLFG